MEETKNPTGDGHAEALASLARREAIDREALRLRSVPSWDWPDPAVSRDAPSEEIVAMFARGKRPAAE